MTVHTPGPMAELPETGVQIHAGGLTLNADLAIPADACGLVIFAHGSGSSRMSPRNRQVARALRAAGCGTLLLDLLTPHEEQIDRLTATHRFNIPLLAQRLLHAVDWVGEEWTRRLPIGLFGASTGAAAALVAAADRPDAVVAVVSRGGRPDLADDALGRVRAPTLLIVGGLDAVVIDLNRRAAQAMRCDTQIAIVPGATHLFEEPGTLEEVSALASHWFQDHFVPRSAGR